MSQTVYTDTVTIGRAGQHADSGPGRVEGKAAESAITWGNVVQRGTSDNQFASIAALPAADADAVATALASAATAQTFVAASFDGEIGAGLITPPRTVRLLLNAHADWDATLLQITYITADGTEKTDIIPIPDAGDVILKTQSPVMRVVSIDLPAQTGTNGTIAVGVDNTEIALDRGHYPGVAMYTPGVEPSTAAVGDVDAEKSTDVLVAGCIYVIVEAAVEAGMPCYVRMVESGTDLRGQVRGDPAANFARLVGASFKTSAAIDGLAILEV